MSSTQESMIELQKYSKIDNNPFAHAIVRQTSKVDKGITYAAAALIFGLVALSLQAFINILMCMTVVDPQEFNLTLFEKETNSDIMKAYVGFVSKFGKVHGSRQESANRYKIFKNNYETIMRHNVNKHLLPFEMEVNYYADMTVDEFLNHHKLRVPHHLLADSLDADERIYSRGHNEFVNRFEPADETIPKSKNWYTEGYVTAPYDQHRCGSCWAFTTAATLESLAVISGKFDKPTEFSVQQLVDCDHTNDGCSGGWMFKGYNYVSKFGIMPKDSYPYVAKQGECKFSEEQTFFKNLGMVQEKNLSNEKLKALVARQPVGVGMVSNENLRLILFRFYKSGVMTEEFLQCSDPSPAVNHGVAIVGYGKVNRGESATGWCSEYWVVRNTWGTQWGDDGFFKLCMDGTGSQEQPYGICQVNRFPTYPTMQSPSQAQAE